MPFLLAGQALRVAVRDGESVVVTSEQLATVTYQPSGVVIPPIFKAGLDTRARVYGPLVAGEVQIAAVAHVDFELVSGSTNPETGARIVALTQQQIDAPSADLLADADATYRLNVAPFTRYRSDGTALVELGAGGGGGGSFATLTGAPGDNAALAAELGAKADLVGGVVPLSQLPPGVGVNRVEVRVTALANITIATALNAGDTIDGVSLVNGDLVLVPFQTNKAENGVYVVGAVPARATAYDTFAEHAGLDVVVSAGTTKAGSTWRFSSGVTGTIGVDPLLVAQIDMTGAALTANNGSDYNAATFRTNIGLGNVNNTSDANKPVSTAQQAAIDAMGAARVKLTSGAPAGDAAVGLAIRYGTPGKKGLLYFNGVALDDSGSYADMLAIASPDAGDTFLVTSIDLGGTVGVVSVRVQYYYTGSAWVPMWPFVFLNVSNSATVQTSIGASTFGACISIVPPPGFFPAGCHVLGQMTVEATINGSDTYTPVIHARGSQLCTSNNPTDNRLRMTPWLWADAANQLSCIGLAGGMDDFVASATATNVTMAAAFNGTSDTLQIGGVTGGTPAGDTTFRYSKAHLMLVP